MKTLAIICVILGVCVYFFSSGYFARGKQIDALEGKINSLELNIERITKNEMEVRKQNEQLKQAAKEDKSGFDWHRDISNSPVVVQLRK